LGFDASLTDVRLDPLERHRTDRTVGSTVDATGRSTIVEVGVVRNRQIEVAGFGREW